jgi:hypothetical protein
MFIIAIAGMIRSQLRTLVVVVLSFVLDMKLTNLVLWASDKLRKNLRTRVRVRLEMAVERIREVGSLNMVDGS